MLKIYYLTDLLEYIHLYHKNVVTFLLEYIDFVSLKHLDFFKGRASRSVSYTINSAYYT